MTGEPQRRNLAMLLLQARESVMGLFRPVLKQFALTEQQWRVIRALSEHPAGEMEAGQIAKICCILSPSLTGMLERMERDALIRRSRIAADQRKVMVSLTPQSRALVRRIAPTIDAQYRALAQKIGGNHLDDIYRLLDSLVGAPANDTNTSDSPIVDAQPASGRSIAASKAAAKRTTGIGAPVRKSRPRTAPPIRKPSQRR